MNRCLVAVGLLLSILAEGRSLVHSYAFAKRAICKRCISTTSYSRFETYHKSCLASCTSCRGMQCRGGDATISLKNPSTSILMATSESSDAPSSHDLSKYHLIWSPGFWKKLVVSMAVWAVFGSLQKKFNVRMGGFLTNISHATCRDTPMRFVLPLLSSSCCALQLVINTISGLGCAGFNTYLGPIRPLFLSIFLILTWKQMWQRHPIWTSASLMLAFLPEAVFVWNKFTTSKFQLNDSRHCSATEEERASVLSTLPVKAKITLDVPTMGCVACVNKVDSSIRSCAFSTNIQREKSWLKDGKGGVAELMVAAESRDAIDKIVEEVVGAVGKAGFQCEVKNVQLNAK